LYKVNTHRGGHSVPTVVSWPARLRGTAQAGTLRSQYVHLIDVLPTVLDVAGIEAPARRGGQDLQPVHGASFAATLLDPAAPPPRADQHYEMFGHRGYYRDGWEVVTLHQPRTPFADDRWELYDLRADPTETTDLAGAHPERVADLAAAWEDEAWAAQVFPLDEGTGLKFLLRPPREDVFTDPVTIAAGTPTLERYRSYKLVQLRSFRIDIRGTHGAGDEGVLVAHGDQGGGYAVYVEDGELTYVHNGYGIMRTIGCGGLGPGEHLVTVDVTAVAGHRWDVVVEVDGSKVGAADGFPMLAFMAPFEGIDVGIDRRSPVSWDIFERHGPFPYTGALESVTYTPGPFAPDAGPDYVDLLVELGKRYE
jgi:arylsulfatase